jgi:hypothetical protein
LIKTTLYVKDVKPSVCREYPMHLRKFKGQDIPGLSSLPAPAARKLLELLY